MIAGFYAVEFTTQLGVGNGVVYLDDGRIHGGDSGLGYVGNYSVNDERWFTADIVTFRHGPPGGGTGELLRGAALNRPLENIQLTWGRSSDG
jgi:hypothetical protein